MPKLIEYPEPKKRFHGGCWRIYWHWKRVHFSIATRHIDKDKTDRINSDLRHISSALAMDKPEFPDEYRNDPAVTEYLRRRLSDDVFNPDWIESYLPTLSGTAGNEWKKHSLRYLRNLEKFAGNITKVTPDIAQEYLNAVLQGNGVLLRKKARRHKPNSPSTHNKALAACSKFFNWAARTHRTRKNPFAGIKQLREDLIENIVYCTRQERREIIKLARESGWPDWISIPIAFYTGMRRGEISRLKWEHISFESGTITVPKSKTGKSRTFPLHKHLESMLKQFGEADRAGHVVKMPTESRVGNATSRLDRMTDLVRHLKRRRESALLKQWGIEKPDLFADSMPRSRGLGEWVKEKKEYQQKMRAWKKERKKHESEIGEALAQIGWNPFRHTFASLAVQSGVPLDAVADWIGDDPNTCRRHYARFQPKDQRDKRIDSV